MALELLRFITLKSLLLDVSNCLFSKNSLGPSLAKNSPDYPYFHGKCKPRQREKDDEVVKERISGISFSPSSQLRTVPFSLLIWFWYILPHPPLHCNCFFWYADLVRKRNLECEEYSLAQRRVWRTTGPIKISRAMRESSECMKVTRTVFFCISFLSPTSQLN